MAGAINAPATGNTYAAYLTGAKALGSSEPVISNTGAVTGGVGATPVSSQAVSSSATTSRSSSSSAPRSSASRSSNTTSTRGASKHSSSSSPSYLCYQWLIYSFGDSVTSVRMSSWQ
ncbi:hypothetical protein F5888DRAFT_321564 [Russula emetica]|nr:hypothetical protein F5888DRAFT_321564 [Russula emetica]